MGVHEFGIGFERVEYQISWTTFDPTNVYFGTRYNPILELRFRWSRSERDGNLEMSCLV